MKRTREKDMHVEIVQEQLIKDNLLLQIQRKNQATPYTLTAVVKYIEDDAIKEDTIAEIDSAKTLEIGEEAIAIFDIGIRDHISLFAVYDMKNHRLAENDLKDRIYQEKFYPKEFQKLLKKSK